MRIGIDFDNTIVCYDGVFHAAALERGLIPEDLNDSKNAVRDHINVFGHKDEFTQLQGYVYGARMDLAKLYEGFADFVGAATQAGHELFIISHKTKYPILGPQYDLHEAARGYLKKVGLVSNKAINAGNLFFELTKEKKIERARQLDLDIFIDDLPEILNMDGFAPRTRKILFDPLNLHSDSPFERHQSWANLTALFGQG